MVVKGKSGGQDSVVTSQMETQGKVFTKLKGNILPNHPSFYYVYGGVVVLCVLIIIIKYAKGGERDKTRHLTSRASTSSTLPSGSASLSKAEKRRQGPANQGNGASNDGTKKQRGSSEEESPSSVTPTMMISSDSSSGSSSSTIQTNLEDDDGHGGITARAGRENVKGRAETEQVMVKVEETRVINGRRGRYVEYKISLVVGGKAYESWRRYSEIYSYHEEVVQCLQVQDRKRVVHMFPRKSTFAEMFSSADQTGDFVRSRADGLQAYFRFLLAPGGRNLTPDTVKRVVIRLEPLLGVPPSMLSHFS